MKPYALYALRHQQTVFLGHGYALLRKFIFSQLGLALRRSL